MQVILNIIQIIISVLLIITIIIQSRGAGLGSAFGGDGGLYHTKRGAEKFLFITTIVLAVIFFGIAVVNIVL